MNAAAAHRLLRGLTGFALAYRALDEPDWRPAWRDAEVLPARVRIALGRPGEVWPELVVPVLAAEPLADVERTEGFGDALMRSRQRGVALVAVLWMVAALSVLALGLAATTRTGTLGPGRARAGRGRRPRRRRHPARRAGVALRGRRV